MNCYDNPVWQCRHCGKIYEQPPAPTAPYKRFEKALKIWLFGPEKTFCSECGGDIERAFHFVRLAASVRPVPFLKQDRRHRMWRWCCWNCGCASELAYGYHSYWPRSSVGGQHTIEKCIPCGKENRLVFPT